MMNYEPVETRPGVMLYAERMLSDKRYRFMSLAERGLYMSMVYECWKNGSVPADIKDLAEYLGKQYEEVSAAATERCLSFFERHGTELICPEIEEYRAAVVERSRKKQQAGARGGKAAAASRTSGLPSNA